MLSKYWCITLPDISEHIIPMLYTFFLLLMPSSESINIYTKWDIWIMYWTVCNRCIYRRIHSFLGCMSMNTSQRNERGNFETNSKWIRRRKAIYVMREIFFFFSASIPSHIWINRMSGHLTWTHFYGLKKKKTTKQKIYSTVMKDMLLDDAFDCV